MKNVRKLPVSLLIAAALICLCAVSAMATPGEFNFDIAGTSVPTTLDGVIAEGEYAGNAPIVVDGTNYYSDGSWVGSFNGEKYSFYFTWDAENLYIGVTVEGDTTPSQNGPEGGDWFRAGDMVQIGFNPDYQLENCHPVILGIGFTADKQVQVRGDAFRSTVDGEQTKDITAEIPGYSKAYSADGINYCAELAIPWVDYIFVNGVGRSGDGAPLYNLTDLTASEGLEIGLWLAMVNDADGPDGTNGDTCMRTDNSNGQAWVAQDMTSICLTLTKAKAAAAARSAFEKIMVTPDQEFYDDPDTLFEGGSGNPIAYYEGYGVGCSSLNDQVIFRDIDFGEGGADKMLINFSNGGEGDTTLAIYIDEKAGDPDATYTIPNTGGWEATWAQDFETPINVKGGIHDVIIEFTNSNSGSFTFIRFSEAPAASASRGEFKFDITGTNTPTALDGVISDGEYAGNAPIVVDGTNYYSDGSWVGSFNGEKYSFYFTWDADNLYVGVTVEGDTTPSQNGPEGGDWFRAGDMVQIGFNPDYRLKDCHPVILGIGFTADNQVQVRGDAFRSTVDGEQTKDITAEIPGYSKAYSEDGINYCAELAIPWVDYIFVNGVGRSGDGAPLYDLTDLNAEAGLDIGLWLAMVNDADGPDGTNGDTCMRTDNSNGQAWVAQGMSSICVTLGDAPAVETPAEPETLAEPEPPVETPAEPEAPAESPVDEELEAKAEAPNTFDFGVIAAVAAMVSLGGFALTKKKH